MALIEEIDQNEEQASTSKAQAKMTDEERAALAEKMDKELDEFIDSLEKRQYTEGWPEDRWEEVNHQILSQISSNKHFSRTHFNWIGNDEASIFHERAAKARRCTTSDAGRHSTIEIWSIRKYARRFSNNVQRRWQLRHEEQEVSHGHL